MHTDAILLDAWMRLMYASVAEDRDCSSQPGPPVTMTMSQAGASSIPNCAMTSSPFDNRTIPCVWRDGADFNLWSYPAGHGKHAESCKIDRFNTVVDEYSE